MPEKINVNIQDRDALVELFGQIKIEGYDHDTSSEFALFTRLLKLKVIRENYNMETFCNILNYYIKNGLRFNDNLSTKKDMSNKIYSFLTYAFSHPEQAMNEDNTIIKSKKRRNSSIIEAQDAEESVEELSAIKDNILTEMLHSIEENKTLSNYIDEENVENGIGCDKCISGYIKNEDGKWSFCDCYIKENLLTRYRNSGIPEEYLKYKVVDDNLVELCAIKNYNKTKEAFKGIALSKYIEKFKINMKSLFDEGWNLIIEGSTGALKTTTACILAKEAIKQNYSVYFIEAQELKNVWLRQENEELKEKIYSVDLLILDDFGQEFISGNSDYQIAELDHLLRSRLSTNKKNIITTNAKKEQIEKRYSSRISSLLGNKMMHLLIKTKKDNRKTEDLPDFF